MPGDGDFEPSSISLFSGAGIGDLGIEYGTELSVSIFSELLESRANLIEHNYPKSQVVKGDIRQNKHKIISLWQEKHQKPPTLITLSPPCQGMSTNGAGKISAEVKKGNRPKYDERNKLLFPGLEIVNQLKPKYFLVENVPNMINTVVVGEHHRPVKLVNQFTKNVPKGYDMISFVLDFADYGVPHHRKRLITIGKKTNRKKSCIKHLDRAPDWFDSGDISERVSVREAIGNLTRTRKNDLLHLMPNMNEKHKYWVSKIPSNSEGTAHLNFCENLECKTLEEFGVVFCSNCKQLLPRPHVVEKDGNIRAVRGFKTSYRRMAPDKPANTITMNSGVPSSDVKIHYSKDRVLTNLEVMILSSLKNISNKRTNTSTNHPWDSRYDFSTVMNEGDYLLQKNIIRETLGESIPPLAMSRIVNSLLRW